MTKSTDSSLAGATPCGVPWRSAPGLKLRNTQGTGGRTSLQWTIDLLKLRRQWGVSALAIADDRGRRLSPGRRTQR